VVLHTQLHPQAATVRGGLGHRQEMTEKNRINNPQVSMELEARPWYSTPSSTHRPHGSGWART
jgi:hypothetical protein